MSYPPEIHRIAVNLLLPPISLETPKVAAALAIPYPTVRKWKIDALAAQDAKIRQDMGTPAAKKLRRAAQIKKDAVSAASQSTLKCKQPNEHMCASSDREGYANNFNLLAEDY